MPQLHMFLSELPPLTDTTGAVHSCTTAECRKQPQKPTLLEEHLPKDSWTKALDSARHVFVEFPTGNRESRAVAQGAAALPYKKLRWGPAAYGEMSKGRVFWLLQKELPILLA